MDGCRCDSRAHTRLESREKLIAALVNELLPEGATPPVVVAKTDNGPEIDEGGQVAALAYGLTPGAPGEFVVMSSPTMLDSFVVGADGTFSQQVFLPAGLAPGRHTLVVATPRLIVGFGFTITAATATPIVAVEAPAALPATGSTGLPTTALWVWLLISGGVSLVLLSRRRRHSSVA